MWCQFSLRQLLLTVAAVCGVLGFWCGTGIRSAYQRSAAIKVIEDLGGVVAFDYQWREDGTWDSRAVAPGSESMKKLFGKYYHAKVVEAQLFSGPNMAPQRFTDTEAAQISSLVDLKWLVLMDTNLTDEGLLQLTQLKNLQRLDLEGTLVTDAGVKRIEEALPNVRVFY
jgi:hypothetical protein